MTHSSHQRRGLTRLAVLCLPVAATLVIPSVAIAATGNSTVRATIAGDGAVKSVKVYNSDGSSSSFSGQVPVKVSISRSVSGNTSTYTYDVENTFSKQQTVTYTDTQGHSHSTSTTLQLPLVAQLGIDVPNTFKHVVSSGGVVTTDPDGTSHILFDLVLFSPLGSPTQTVTFTANGSGAPTAELAAQPVNPNVTTGLSASSQDANASSQQDDFWRSYASGGDDGLTQLANGMSQLIAGLNQLAPGAHKLADGIKAAGAGAKLLDAGTKQAYNGAKELNTGAASAYSGAKKLDAGTKAAYSGAQQLDAGTKAAHTGSTQLASGIGQINTGQTSLTAGLAQINAGLAQLDDKTPGKGVQAAVDGLKLIQAGIKAMEAGVGNDATPLTLINGVDQIRDGLSGELTGLLGAGTLASPQGLTGGVGCVAHILQVVTGAGENAATVAADPCMVVAGITGAVTGVSGFSDPTTAGAVGKVLANLVAPTYAGLTNPDPTQGVVSGLQALYQGALAVRAGLSHAPNPATNDQGGIAEGLAGVDAGLAQLLDPAQGLPAAVAGLDQLNAGSASALSGSQQLTAGSGQALTGAQALDSGLGQLATGQDQLTAGLGQLAPGQDALTAGLGKISGGLAALTPGLGKLSAGQHESATGLPAAVTGSAQIAGGIDQVLSGSQKVKDGIGQVQTGATKPLLQQLTEGSQNAKKQLAILDAAASLASQAPGGAGTSYVLSQSPLGFRLAASTSAAKSSDHTGRNVGIGLGAFAALIVAVVAGFALGRRSSVTV